MNSYKEKFSEDDWMLLSTTPSMIGSAVAGAGSSGIIGTLKEAYGNVRSIMEGASQFPDNPLIGTILEKPESIDAAKELMTKNKAAIMARMEAQNVKTPADIKKLCIEDCTRTVALLESSVAPEIALEYKSRLMNIGQRVAEAAKEGGFLGFGGQRVSEEESQLLEEIQGILNL